MSLQTRSLLTDALNQWEDIASPFDQWVEIFNSENHLEVEVVNGVPFVFTSSRTDELVQAVLAVVPIEEGLGVGKNDNMACNKCRSNLLKMMGMKDSQNKSYFMPNEENSYPESFRSLKRFSGQMNVTHPRVVSQSDFGLCYNGSLDGKPFHHFSVNTHAPTLLNISDEDVLKNQRFLDKYIPLATVTFSAYGKPGIKESLNLLLEVLPTVTYGSKLMKSMTWFRDHIVENFDHMNRLNQLVILTRALLVLKCVVTPGSGDIAAPAYHQVTKNGLEALNSAKDLDSLKNLLQERFSPLNYQVKTAAPTQGQIANAINHIGEFEVVLMTVDEAVSFGAKRVKHSNNSSSNVAYASFQIKVSDRAQGGGKGALSFSNRCNASVSGIKTMMDLWGNIPENLEVNVCGKTPCYTNKFVGMKDGVHRYPYTWGFQDGRSPKDYGMDGWVKVLAIFRMEDNFLFICDKAVSNSEIMNVCCHTALLTPEYNRICGPMFGKIKDTPMKLVIPSGDQSFAIGVGVSLNKRHPTDKNPPITARGGPITARGGSFRLRSNTTEFTIK
jgi:hypothetical protein